jgi:hypothetical protein
MKPHEWKELKNIVEVSAAAAERMEIEFQNPRSNDWCPWKGEAWFSHCLYRARPLKPVKMQVKSLCWRESSGFLYWRDETWKQSNTEAKRFPSGDLTGEVEA